MAFYLFLTLILTFPVYLSENNFYTRFFDVSKEKSTKYTLVLSCLLSIFIVSIRNFNMADDTMIYYEFFNAPYIGFAEFGFYILNKFVRLFTTNFNIFLACCSSLSIIPFYYIISKIQNDKWIYIFLYHVFLLYIFNFAIIRQTIAMSFVFLALFIKNDSNFKNNIYLSILFYLIAISFHRISLVFIPLFFIDYIFKYRKIIIFILLLSCSFIIFKDCVLNFIFLYLFPDKVIYLNNSSTISDFGIIPFLIFLSSEIVILMLGKQDLSILRKINYYFLYLTIFFFWFPAYGRILQFGYMNIIFLLGNTYNLYIKHNKIYKYLFIILCILFYLYMLSRNPYHVIPYISIFL